MRVVLKYSPTRIRVQETINPLHEMLTGAFVDHTTIPATGRLFSAGSVNVTAVCDLAISSVTVDANVSSNGGSDAGALTVSTTGGTAPLTYAWTGGATTASITGPCSGTMWLL